MRRLTGGVAAIAMLPAVVVATTTYDIAGAASGDVVINEIYYHPVDDDPDGEFLELHNTTSSAIDLNGWCVDGIKFCFTDSAPIAAGGFLTLGSPGYEGALSNGGEELILLDPNGAEVDVVDYDDKDDWPAFADGEGDSLQRLDPKSDGDDPGNWRSDPPTPNARNTVRSAPMPVWSDVKHTTSPAPGAPVVVTASVRDAAAASITYVIGFNAPITVDVAIEDGAVRATIPGQPAGTLIRYRLNGGSTRQVIGTWPRQGDGATYTGTTVASASNTDLPRFEWFMPDAAYDEAFRDLTLTGDDGYPAVLAHGGEIFDNTKVRVKGQISRLQPKKKWKFILAPGRELEIDGLLPEGVDEFALHSNWSDKSFLRETIAYEAFDAAGVQVSQAFPVQLERNNQFYGLYTYVEQQDGTWRDRWGLDEGAIYEVGGGNVFGLLMESDARLGQSALRRKYEKETKEFEDDTKLRELITVLNGTSGSLRRTWIEENVDVPSVVNTIAASMVFQHQDYGFKNYRLTYNQLGKWTTIPTDFDLTFGHRARISCGATCDEVGIGGAFEHPGGPLFLPFFTEPDLAELVRQRIRTITEEILRDGGLQARVIELRDSTADEALRDRAIWGTYGAQKAPVADANDIIDRFMDPQVSRLLGTMVSQGRVAPSSTPIAPRLEITKVEYGENGIVAPHIFVRNLEGVMVDISSYAIDELDYEVPGGTILMPGQTLAIFNEDAGEVAPLFRGLVLGGTFPEDLDDQRGFTITNRRGVVVAAWTSLLPGEFTEISGAPNRSGIISLTSTVSGAAGYLQVVDCDADPSRTSNVNNDGPLQNRAGAAIVRFDDDGKACIFNSASTHVVVDLQGYLDDSAVDDVADIRLIDTRDLGARRAAGSQTKITGRPNSSAFVSMVAVETTTGGFLQVLPCGSTPGKFSNNNYDGANQIRSSLSVVRFDANGEACIYTHAASHIVADLQAYVADDAVDDIADVRLLDTRAGAKPAAGSVTKVRGRPNSVGIGGVVATETEAAGFLQVVPCSVEPGKNSNVNFESPGQNIVSLAMLPFDAAGEVCIYAHVATHIVVDMQASFESGSFDDIADDRLADTRDD